MEEKNGFTEVLEKLEKRTEKAGEILKSICFCCQEGRTELAYEQAFRLEENMEKTVKLARMLPAYTGHEEAAKEVQDIIRKCISVEIGFTREGWFSVRMPALLPKKKEQSADYVRSFLYPAVKDFFCLKEPVKFQKCVCQI